jgi:hypothetical protein
MTPSATTPDPELVALAAEAVEELLGRLTPTLCAFTYPTSLYAFDMAVDATQRRPTEVREFMWREARERVLPDVVEPEHPDAPFDVEEAVKYAGVLAADAFRAVGASHADRYPEGLLDPAAAPGYGAEALVAWHKAVRKGRVERMWAYVRQTLKFMVADVVDDALRAADPDAWRFHRLTKRFLAEDPDPDTPEARRRAERKAREQLDREGGFIERIDDPERVDDIEGPDDVERLVGDASLLDWIRRLLAGPGYTDLDRETWSAFEAAGFRGRDIAWADLDVDAHVGATRLWALLRKLRRDLGDGLGL